MARKKKDPADARNIPVVDANGQPVRDRNGHQKMRAAASTRCDLSVSEKLQVKQQAQAAGLTEADFVRNRVLGYQVPPAMPIADAELIAEVNRASWELNRIGQNIDQILLATYRGRESEYAHSWQEIQAITRKAAQRAEAVLERITSDGT